MRQYAFKGEEVVCERGHALFVIPQDIPLQRSTPGVSVVDKVSAAVYTPRCPTCNAPYARWMGAAQIEFHFADGWRTQDGKAERPRPVEIAAKRHTDVERVRRQG